MASRSKINTLQSDKLVPIIKERDTLIAETRDEVIPTLTEGLNDIKEVTAISITFLQAKIDTGDTTFATGKKLDLEEALAITNTFQRTPTKVTDDITTLRTGLKALQAARSTCMSELL